MKQFAGSDTGRTSGARPTGRSAKWRAILAAGVLVVAQQAALGADDRFDRAKYDGLGGFRPVANETYRKECGTCHFAYLPGLLPERSWKLVLERANEHFGETLDLPPERAAQLRAYLLANAADKVPDKGSIVLLERLGSDVTPSRITALPRVYRDHVIVREVIKISTAVQARTITNCDTCHRKAAEGSFANRDLIVPGLTKVVRPGGGF
jgi:hypothetical protein